MGRGRRAEPPAEGVLNLVGEMMLAAEDDDLVGGERVADGERGLVGDVAGGVDAFDQAPMFSPSLLTVMPPAA